jgi:predicted transposase/invertase (TIGR01784 family)
MVLKPARFLRPTADLVFKKIFGEHPALIKSFLNGILPLAEDELIESLEYLHPEQTPTIPAFKNTIVDVKCHDRRGRIFIVEMQVDWTSHFDQRLLFGTSKAYVQQLKQGEDYSALCPVYGLGIINDTFDSSTEWFHHYRTVNVKYPEIVLKGLELIFVELPKFKPHTLVERKMGVLWLRFLREINETLIDVPEEFSSSPEIGLALQLAQESSYTEGELESYHKYWDAVSVEKTVRKSSFNQGEQIGLEKGEQIGLEKGKRIGREEGEQIGFEKARKDIVQKLVGQGMNHASVMQMMGLSVEEFQKLLAGG